MLLNASNEAQTSLILSGSILQKGAELEIWSLIPALLVANMTKRSIECNRQLQQ
jgi:hypothetical protein